MADQDAIPTPPKSRLLIVDDDPGTIRVLSEILKDAGRIYFATSGEDALSMIDEKQPDIVLLDVEMPGMSGFEVCSAIKAQSAHADLPILFITSHNDSETESRALEIGGVDYIIKPPNPMVVRARVKTHLILKQRTDELRRLVMIDGLTGVSNRRAFDQALDVEWRRGCRSNVALSLLMIDIDHFKRFNDLYGHQTGDSCLKAVATTLAGMARRPGEIVARYGGEEFAVILPGSDADTAWRTAEWIRNAIADMILSTERSPKPLSVTVSIGVATMSFADREVTAERGTGSGAASGLIRRADGALYNAKAAGRNMVKAAE